MEAILSLGSNLGDRLANLRAADAALAALPSTRIVARAAIYETDPVDVPDSFHAARFLNTILAVETDLLPETLAEAIHAVEAQLGRRRGPERHVPRVIDIDLIVCGDTRRDTPELRLPHPEAAWRRFVMQPLADIRPDLILPGHALPVRDLLAQLPQTPAVALAEDQWE